MFGLKALPVGGRQTGRLTRRIRSRSTETDQIKATIRREIEKEENLAEMRKMAKGKDEKNRVRFL